MLRIDTGDQWQEHENLSSQKGPTRWQEAMLCVLSVALTGFLVGLCYRTSAPVAYSIALLVVMALLLIPLITRQVCCSCHYIPFGLSLVFVIMYPQCICR